jgi:hypothetical protein
MARKSGRGGGGKKPFKPNIITYGERTIPFDLSGGDGELIEAIDAHLEKHLGPVASVHHEIVSDLVHIDLHLIAPTPERNFYTVVTSGMSEVSMTVPEGCEEFRFAELMLALPPTWPLGEAELNDEANYWPLRWLKILARFPHEYDTWLAFGHSIPNGNPPEPFHSSVPFCCHLLREPRTTPEEFFRLEFAPERTINFWAVVPLHSDEMDFKLRHPAEKLCDRLDRHGVTELIDVNRPSVIKQKR